MSLKTLAIKVMPGEYDIFNISPQQIIDMHSKKEAETGKVWFSTNLSASCRNLLGTDKVLLFGNGVQYFADLDHFQVEDDAFVPEKAYLHSPALFAGLPARTWLMLTNIRPASDKELSALTANDGTSALDKANASRRYNMFYCA